MAVSASRPDGSLERPGMGLWTWPLPNWNGSWNGSWNGPMWAAPCGWSAIYGHPRPRRRSPSPPLRPSRLGPGLADPDGVLRIIGAVLGSPGTAACVSPRSTAPAPTLTQTLFAGRAGRGAGWSRVGRALALTFLLRNQSGCCVLSLVLCPSGPRLRTPHATRARPPCSCTWHKTLTSAQTLFLSKRPRKLSLRRRTRLGTLPVRNGRERQRPAGTRVLSSASQRGPTSQRQRHRVLRWPGRATEARIKRRLKRQKAQQN